MELARDGVGRVRQQGDGNAERHMSGVRGGRMRGYSLDEWREPAHEGERLAAVSVRRSSAQDFPRVLLVESEPKVRHQPSELDNDERALEADKTHDRREGHVCHRQRLTGNLMRMQTGTAYVCHPLP